MHRKAVSTGKTGRACSDHGDMLPGRLIAVKRLFAALEQVIRCKPL
jgi:hypothetical protein